MRGEPGILAFLFGPRRVSPRRSAATGSIRRLGQGGFGRVYLARDDELDRPVAIKVPNPERVAGPEDVEAYLAEARTLARLDHPNIVPVYDVGRTDDGLCYVVSKYVEGSDLAERMRQGRLTFRESAELVAAVAEALHHAHTRGLVHRDVKPANILIDAVGQAVRGRLRAGAQGRGLRQGGPARRHARLHEPRAGPGRGAPGRRPLGHLQPGRRLLRAADRPEAVPGRDARRRCMEQIATRRAAAAPPDRRHDPPRAGADLPEGAGEAGVGAVQHGPRPGRRPAALPPDRRGGRFAGGRSRAGQPAARLDPGGRRRPRPPRRGPTPTAAAVKIVPKGLRSFDQHDADFFLELLPGPRDRDGLPESIRFWKTRIETTDPDADVPGRPDLRPVGLRQVVAGQGGPAAPAGASTSCRSTSRRRRRRPRPGCSKALRKACPDLPAGLGLVEALAALRRGRVAARRAEGAAGPRPVRAVAVRPAGRGRTPSWSPRCGSATASTSRRSSWSATTSGWRRPGSCGTWRSDLVEGENSAAVDLFDPRHARKVLAAFGRAYGVLPEKPASSPPSSRRSSIKSVAGLAQDGKVISVRLALFAEMVKGKPWTPATLREVGGTRGRRRDVPRGDLQRAARAPPSTACTRRRPRPS